MLICFPGYPISVEELTSEPIGAFVLIGSIDSLD